MRNKGYYLLKGTGPVEQRQMLPPNNRSQLKHFACKHGAAHCAHFGGNPVATGSNQFCSSSCPFCSVGCEGLGLRPQHTHVPSQHAHVQTWAGGPLLGSRGQRGPNLQAIAWHTALPLASHVSSMVSGQARGDGPCCPSGCGNSIFFLPIPAAGFCYKPNNFQSTIYSQVHPPSVSGLRYFTYSVKPRREVLTSEMWTH